MNKIRPLACAALAFLVPALAIADLAVPVGPGLLPAPGLHRQNAESRPALDLGMPLRAESPEQRSTLRCYQHGVRVVDEDIPPGGAQNMSGSKVVFATLTHGRSLAILVVGDGLCLMRWSRPRAVSATDTPPDDARRIEGVPSSTLIEGPLAVP